MFRTIVSPIFRSTLTVYTALWNTVPTVLPTVTPMSPVGSRQQILHIVPKKAVYTVEVFLKMDETVARNM